MPLYIDYHQLEGDLTIEDVRTAHRSDLANQEKYGVRYLQFWVNEKAAMVYCLIEGPNPESCVECHLTSHGNTPCNIQEVEPGFFKLFMGEGLPIDDYHMTLTKDGKADPANRIIMVCDIRGINFFNDGKGYQRMLISTKPKNLVVDSITRFNGRFIEHITEDGLAGVFNSPINAIRCARSIHDQLLRLSKEQSDNNEWNVVFRLALNEGQPLTKEDGFFEVAIKQAKRLCMIAGPNQIVLSAHLKDIFEMEKEASVSLSFPPSVKILTKSKENFIYELFEHTEKSLQMESFNINHLCRLIGDSRTQLYRKTISLTGKSPNRFIKEMRMRKAWKLIISKQGNISEISQEVGYSNPSYFSKTFQESFGYTPSELYTNIR
jgi:AraC-like DNA-binding protein